MQFRCEDVGVACKAVTHAPTKEELVAKVAAHAKAKAKRGGGGIRRDPDHRRALLLDPAALLARGGMPGRFAPGRWDVATSTDGIDLTFR